MAFGPAASWRNSARSVLAAFAALFAATVGANAGPGQGVRAPQVASPALVHTVQAGDREACIFRCRVLREECAQDSAAASRPDRACWDGYAVCRDACSSGNSAGTSQPIAPHGPAPIPVPGPIVTGPVVLPAELWPVGKWPEGIASDGRSLWVAESGKRRIAQLDPNDGRVIKRVRVGRLPVSMHATGDGRVFSLVFTDQLVWAQHGRGGRLVKLDHYPEAMAGDDQHLWILTHPGGSSASAVVVKVDQQNGTTNQSQVLGHSAAGLAITSGRVWVVHGSGKASTITVLDRDSLALLARFDINQFLTRITANHRGVFLGGGSWDTAGSVIRLDPTSGRELGRINLPGQFIYAMAVTDDYVIAGGRRGKIWILSADDLSIRREIDTSIGTFAPQAILALPDRLLITSHRGQGDDGSVVVVRNWQP